LFVIAESRRCGFRLNRTKSEYLTLFDLEVLEQGDRPGTVPKADLLLTLVMHESPWEFKQKNQVLLFFVCIF